MSKIALTPNASGTGTLTIAAPNTNTDSTINLPDSAGSFVTADTSGNVGIGTSSTSYKLDVQGTPGSNPIALFKNTAASGEATLRLQTAANDKAVVEYYTNGNGNWRAGPGITTAGAFEINSVTAGATRMLIDSSGNLLVGRTAPGTINVAGTCIVPDGSIIIERDNNQLMSLNRLNGNGTLILFQRGAGNVVGSIVGNTSSTSYNTSSDYRLKEDVQPMSGSIDRVKTLNPVNFAWKVDGSRVDGFLAHETQEVVPEAVTGTKDAVDADGNPEYQGIDQSKLVPLLTAALKEAITEIESLKARVATLEAA